SRVEVRVYSPGWRCITEQRPLRSVEHVAAVLPVGDWTVTFTCPSAVRPDSTSLHADTKSAEGEISNRFLAEESFRTSKSTFLVSFAFVSKRSVIKPFSRPMRYEPGSKCVIVKADRNVS